MRRTIIDPANTMTTEEESINAPRPAALFIAHPINPSVPTNPITVAISIKKCSRRKYTQFTLTVDYNNRSNLLSLKPDFS
jgi:hypothetical protein